MVKHFFIVVASLLIASASAQDKPPEKKDGPKIILAAPLVVSPNVAAKITLRGMKLDTASEVAITGVENPPKIELKKKEKSNPPNGINANEIGDSFVEIEFTLPENFAAADVQLAVTNPDGTSQPYNLAVKPADKLQAESEPNEAFRKCNKLAVGQTIVGSVHQQRDVDVFEIEAQAGQALVAETFAARRGSALDPLLILYDAAGQVLAQSDDQPEHRDALLKYKTTSAGKFYLGLLDAHDRGSGGHPYLLELRAE
ncbi:PPC domain-containing protein [Anatilimnocola floriformis]|uniref:PPC domain-containing protein n=1 Tax=Anatilimnocola floriformis TaxID=2948575 RepID=UPI0020C3C854|nr:PPC domain-containing protein [Anatilimnocola floriformis]